MFNIGEFARLGRVSIRMLRHYDEIGVLTPAAVDPDSSYRLYSIDQLPRLNRLIALKELGFKLEQVRVMLDESVDADELAGMLRLRRAELEAQIRPTPGRLARVEARLRSIQEEGQMITQDVAIKSVPSIRVAEVRGTAGSWAPEDIGPEIKLAAPAARRAPRGRRRGAARRADRPLRAARGRHGHRRRGRSRSTPSVGEHHGFTVTELPPLERAATHAAPRLDGRRASLRTRRSRLSGIEENGLRSVGLSREITLQCPADEDGWVTELQITVVDA